MKVQAGRNKMSRSYEEYFFCSSLQQVLIRPFFSDCHARLCAANPWILVPNWFFFFWSRIKHFMLPFFGVFLRSVTGFMKQKEPDWNHYITGSVTQPPRSPLRHVSHHFPRWSCFPSRSFNSHFCINKFSQEKRGGGGGGEVGDSGSEKKKKQQMLTYVLFFFFCFPLGEPCNWSGVTILLFALAIKKLWENTNLPPR